jgi:hypothetical protein
LIIKSKETIVSYLLDFSITTEACDEEEEGAGFCMMKDFEEEEEEEGALLLAFCREELSNYKINIF